MILKQLLANRIFKYLKKNKKQFILDLYYHEWLLSNNKPILLIMFNLYKQLVELLIYL